MVDFFKFNYITAPPDDEFVDEEIQLNANWDELEKKLNWLQGFGTLVGADLDIGVEARRSARHDVWTGSAFISPTSIATGWTAWATVPPKAPYVIRSGFPIRWRSNPLVRRVQMVGVISNTSTVSTPFPKATWFTMNDATIPSTFQPVGGAQHIQHCSMSALNGAAAGNDVAVGRIRVSPNGVNPLLIEGHWMGQDASSNYFALDGLDWYY